MKRFYNFILLLIFPLSAYSETSRISSKIMDLGSVGRIYMVPGLATLIELPEAVTGVRLGNPDLVQYYKPNSPNNEVTLVLKSELKTPTNLIIRSGRKKYVFDIIPSKNIHQDLIEVISSVGSPSLDDSKLEILYSSSEELK